MRTIRRVVKAVAIVALVGGVAYWLKFTPVAVARHTLAKGDVVAEVMGTGTLEAHVKAIISPKIAGLITRVAVDQGDRVTAAQPLVQLDDRDLEQQVEIAQATVAAAAAGLDRLRADKERAIAVFEQAGRDHRRFQSLLSADTAAKVEYEKAVEALGVAQADLTRTEAAIIEGMQQVAAAMQTLEYHRARLADTVIKAPFDGLIVRRERDPGNVVVPGSAILAIVSTSELWVSAWVDETEMGALKPGQSARVVFRSQPDRSYGGRVARLGREADRETREFLVDVQVESLPENWAIGQRAEVYIETARRAQATSLPSTLVTWRDGKPGAFVDVAGRVQWRPLSLGLRSREAVEILGGLTTDEPVIRPVDAKAGPLTVGRRIRGQ